MRGAGLVGTWVPVIGDTGLAPDDIGAAPIFCIGFAAATPAVAIAAAAATFGFSTSGATGAGRIDSFTPYDDEFMSFWGIGALTDVIVSSTGAVCGC